MSEVMALSRAQVFRYLSIADCTALMDRALRSVSAGQTLQPVRTRMAPPTVPGALGLMPGYSSDPRALGIKVVSVFEGNFAKGLPSHRGVVLLFDADDGALKGIFDAGAITAVRTAAASAAATAALAVAGAERLAILGYGEQALAHVEAMLLVRPVREVTLWGRSEMKAAEFAARIAELHSIDARAEATVEKAVADSQIICTVTAAREPILRGDAVPAGCHVNLVGSSFPDAREADSRLVARSRFFVDSRSMAEALGGELIEAVRDGSIESAHLLGEIGDVLNGTMIGRRHESDVTVFKSLGLIAEDLFAATFLYDAVMRDPTNASCSWIDL